MIFYFCLSFSNFIVLDCILHIEICTSAGSFPGGIHGKESASQTRRHKRCGSDSRVGKIPWKRKWQSTPVLLSGNFHAEESGRLQSTGLQRAGHDRGYTHALILFYCTFFIVLHRYRLFFFFFLKIAGLQQSFILHVYKHQFSNTIYSLHVSMSHFGNSCNILNSLIIIFIRVVCDQ